MTRLRKTIMVGLILVGLLMPACTFIATAHLDQELRSIVKPYTFNLWKHELEAAFRGLKEIIRPGGEVKADDTAIVREYFMLVGQIKAIESMITASDGDDEEAEMLAEALTRLEGRRTEIEDKTRRIVAKQIEQVLVDKGIRNPLDKYLGIEFVFPPLIFELEKPPNLLVISPRDSIELDKRILMSPDLELGEKEAIESQVDDLDVSSLIVGLGGFAGVWPTMVAEDNELRHTINLVVEEWFHQYLAFRPLGFLYLLDSIGVRGNVDVVTMNETLAGMVSEEITSEVLSTFYEGEAMEDQFDQAGFDFDEEMRQTRRAVDEFLSLGEIEEAEEFMEERRQQFVGEGYYIRKLNQAYFAFHNIYAYKPASISPIDEDLRELRAQSDSLEEFLDEVTGMTGYDDLRRAVRD